LVAKGHADDFGQYFGSKEDDDREQDGEYPDVFLTVDFREGPACHRGSTCVGDGV
jgi:hypothetical protein